MADDFGRPRSPDALSLRDRFPAIDRFGVAVDWHDGYVNREQRPQVLDVVLLTLVVSGRGRHIVGDDERPISGPCLDVSRLGEAHALVTEPDGMRVVNVYLADDRRPSPPLGDGLDEALAGIIPAPAPFRVPCDALRRWDVADPDALLALLRDLDDEIADDGPGSRAAVGARLTLLLRHCARAVRDAGLVERVEGTSTARAIDRVRRHLDGHFAEQHTLSSLAALANLERTSFSRAFRARIGLPVVRYLNQQRIRAAARMLTASDEPIAGIAGRCGYRDLSHFQRMFKAIVGMAPGAYRERNA